MGRFRDTRTNVVVDVDEDTAASLGAAYVPAGEAPSGESEKAPAKKAAAPKPSGK